MFIELLSVCLIGTLGESLISNSIKPTKCVSLKNRPCQARPTLVNVNCDETYNKCGGSGNTIDDPYTQVCVSNKVKNMKAKVFHLMSRVNETGFLVKHESCESVKNETVSNSKQKWNHNECQCECKKLDDWGYCEKGYMMTPSTCNCKCSQACKIDEYLDTKTCSYEKLPIGKLGLECEDEILNTTETLLNDNRVAYAKSNCFIRAILFVIICLLLLVVICVSFYFYYRRYRPKQKHSLPFQDTRY